MGIDIGTHSIKIVELSGNKEKIQLENYGEIFLADFCSHISEKGSKGVFLYSNEDIAGAIKALISEAGIKSKKAYFSIPDFVTFFTLFDLPPVKDDEMNSAVEFHSRQHIPLPIEEVVLDWSIVEREESKIKINLIAIPKEIVNQYQEIAQMSDLDIISLEGEMFSLARALTYGDGKTAAIIDIGEQSTMLAIARNGILKTTHSIEVAGNMLVKQVAKAKEIEYNDARRMVMEHGLAEESVRAPVSFLANSLFSSISQAINVFERKEKTSIEEVIVGGGFSLLPGVVEVAENAIDKNVVVKNCFENMIYPESLNNTLMRLSSSHSIATGVALIGILKEE